MKAYDIAAQLLFVYISFINSIYLESHINHVQNKSTFQVLFLNKIHELLHFLSVA